ncbi:MAG: glycine zipper 2TM domain-containing protein [Steroidobacteraceae bacterium]|nr:glycine zipper 2TM domain-containing protein [Steroidobacteraceae bacterium]
MNRQTLIGVAAGAVAVTALGAVATSQYGLNPFADYATVVAVEPAFDVHRIPRQECREELVERQVAPKDEKRVAGTVIGAAVGGVLGNQVGSGSGRTAATVAGAAAGGYAGSKIQKEMQQGNTEQVAETRCMTVYDTERTPAGYDVTWEFDGRQGIVRMDREPGKRIPVRDGQPVVAG